MRYLHLQLAGGEATLHPLVAALTDQRVAGDARMVDWAPSFDPPRVTVLLYLEGDLDRFAAVLAETDLVRRYDVSRFAADRGYVYVHSDPHPTEWRLFGLAMGEGLVPVFPVEYHHDGSLSVRVVGPPAALQAAVEGTPDGVRTSVEQVGEYDLGRPPIPPGLPPRQREALVVAHEMGYYAVPRETTRDEVARALDCAPATASEHLRKAERHLVETFLGAR